MPEFHEWNSGMYTLSGCDYADFADPTGPCSSTDAMSESFSGRTISMIAAANHQNAWTPAKSRITAGMMRLLQKQPLLANQTGMNHPTCVRIYALAWSPMGELLLSGGSDGMLRWWDLQHEECVRVREGHKGAVQSLKVSSDGRRLASCGDDNVNHVWDLESGERLRTLQRDRPYERLDISGVKGLTEGQRASLRALGAIEGAP